MQTAGRQMFDGAVGDGTIRQSGNQAIGQSDRQSGRQHGGQQAVEACGVDESTTTQENVTREGMRVRVAADVGSGGNRSQW